VACLKRPGIGWGEQLALPIPFWLPLSIAVRMMRMLSCFESGRRLRPGVRGSRYQVELYASGLDNPRLIRTAPNGDLFVAESRPGRIRVLRGFTGDGKPEKVEVFASGLREPFEIAFYPPGPAPKFIYIGNTDSVVRFPYENGDLKASGSQQVVVPHLPAGGRLRGGGHWTRDLAFSLDGKRMYISVGSYSNADDVDNNPVEFHRADILEASPDGAGLRLRLGFPQRRGYSR